MAGGKGLRYRESDFSVVVILFVSNLNFLK